MFCTSPVWLPVVPSPRQPEDDSSDSVHRTRNMTHEFQAAAEDAGKRLDVFLVERLGGLGGGESGAVEWQPPRPLHAFPEDIPIEVLYEDDDFIAVNKPAGLMVHAGAGRQSGALVNGLLHRFGQLSTLG